MVVALLTTALLIVNLYPEIWKGLLEERILTLIALGVSLTAIIVLLAIGGASLGWTGFGDKTFWDWLQLLSALAIPVVLAAAGLWFTAQQDQRQQNIEERRARQAQNIENQRAEAERKLAEQRAQDEALQSYLNQMSQLMLERKLLETEQGDPAHTLAQARTSTAILRLDAEHNKSLTRFLVDSGLVVSGDHSPRLLFHIALTNATLSGALLPNADLSYAVLDQADLTGANLWSADLEGADLEGADLSNALLDKANLRFADLRFADLTGAYLIEADLRAELSEARLDDAHLGNADLSEAYLPGADLSDADLFEADLSGAYLREADLSGANLVKAEATPEQLEQAKSLKDAYMPNGQKYEEWLKDREKRQQDE
jgi:uncharacterized protein YjbI with pentapeptide repeats